MSDQAAITREDLTGLGLKAEEAEDFLRGLSAAPRGDASDRWAFLTREVLRPWHPAAIHERLFHETYRDWDVRRGPAPAWRPDAGDTARSNLGRLIASLGFTSEAEFRAWSVRDPGGFWGAMAEALGIRFERPYDAVLDLSEGPERPRWFPGGRLNIAASCFAAAPGAVAVRQHGERGERRELTYAELERLTARVAAALTACGLAPGDPVGLLLPLTVEAVAVMLGVVRAGRVVVAVAESFAPLEIERRLALGGARWVVTQDVIVRRGARLPLYTKLDGLDAVHAVVISTAGEPPPRLRPGDRTWDDFLAVGDAAGEPDVPPVPAEPGAAMTLLFSSGTTADPKAIPWPHTTPIKAAADGFLYQDVQPGDVVAWPTSPGWMMGPWLVFAALINRGTVALFDGHPGTAGFCRFVAEAGVTQLGTVPALVAAWLELDRRGELEGVDWSRLKLFSSTGECSRPGDMLALMARAGYRPVIEYCGGTEVGGGYITSSLLRPNAPSCFNTVAYGVGLDIRDESGRPADRGEAFLSGTSVGLSTELSNGDHHAIYYEGTPSSDGLWPLRRHGDAVERLSGGFFRVLGRVDDAMNLGGIKVTAVEIESVWNSHPRVAESAAVAVRDPGGGPEQLVAYVVPRGADPLPEPATLLRELQALLAQRLNPLFRPVAVALVDALPRTASHKVMRRLLRTAPSLKADGP